jgi:hypothetical protein
VTDPEQGIERELARLAAATEAVRPRAGFEARVLAAVSLERAPGWERGVLRFGKAMLAAAAVSALLSVIAAARTDEPDDDAVAMTYGLEEMDW